ncbi:MAG: mercury(II) reductase [Bacteroidetes bacterium]|jgi:mercuric reductase|nr:mercury(II) reductase [Bacteroidota bacterium]
MSKKDQLNLSIRGMTCHDCARSIDQALSKKEGIRKKLVSYPNGKAEIAYDADAISKEELIKTINSIDHYEAAEEVESSEDGDKEFDLLIIGGGSAAFAAAIRTSELGGRALIINKGLPTGGTCVNTGCVPSKTLIRTAEAIHKANHPNVDGIESKATITDFKKMMEQKRQMVQDLRQNKYVDVIADDPNIQLLHGYGRFVDDHTVDVDGSAYGGRNILIATGAAPHVPDIEGLQEAGYLTNESAYELDELPERLIVLGGGYIALENGQLFSRMGSKVTIIQRSPHVLSDQPEELGRELAGYLEEEGITVMTNTLIKEVSKKEDGTKVVHLTVDGNKQTVEADDLLVATGRRGNTALLDLEKIGIETHGRDTISVDETLRTSVDHIFAAGDVLGDRQFVYTAAYEGKMAAENAMRGSRQPTDYSVLPWVIFTDPQVAGVGMDEEQAREAGIDVDVAKLSLEHVPRSIVDWDTRGYIKLIRNRENDVLVGARILAPEGSELLMELALAIRHKIPVESMKSEFHPYLTHSEGVKLAAITFGKDVGKLSCCAT